MSLKPRQKATRIQVGTIAFTMKGISRFDVRDPYHFAVTLSWPQFLLTLLSLYLCVNIVFATLYTLVPGSVVNAHVHNFADAFFFSFETLATVGYGEMYPGNLYGHIVACAEITSGIAFTAILTGLTFVRFSRPRAKFVLADKLVVASYNGKPTLMLRIGNGRPDFMTNVSAQLNVLLAETSREGTTFRRAHALKLVRGTLPILPLAWTLMHEIDAESPLAGMDQAAMEAADARLFLSLEARDPSLSATVYEMRTFLPEAVVFGMRYADAVTTQADGDVVLDIDLIGAMEPDSPNHVSQGGLG